MNAEMISLPSRTMEMMTRMREAALQVKSVPISALMASTVLSSTMAFTCCITDPISVSNSVRATSRR